MLLPHTLRQTMRNIRQQAHAFPLVDHLSHVGNHLFIGRQPTAIIHLDRSIHIKRRQVKGSAELLPVLLLSEKTRVQVVAELPICFPYLWTCPHHSFDVAQRPLLLDFQQDTIQIEKIRSHSTKAK